MGWNSVDGAGLGNGRPEVGVNRRPSRKSVKSSACSVQVIRVLRRRLPPGEFRRLGFRLGFLLGFLPGLQRLVDEVQNVDEVRDAAFVLSGSDHGRRPACGFFLDDPRPVREHGDDYEAALVLHGLEQRGGAGLGHPVEVGRRCLRRASR